MHTLKQKYRVELLDEVEDFLDGLNEKARKKIIYNIKKSQFITDNELFKKLSDNVWEFRTLYNKTYYRLFAFWDKSDSEMTLVISTHGIEKKTAKTPQNEIAKTERIMKQYFAAKNK